MRHYNTRYVDGIASYRCRSLQGRRKRPGYEASYGGVPAPGAPVVPTPLLQRIHASRPLATITYLITKYPTCCGSGFFLNGVRVDEITQTHTLRSSYGYSTKRYVECILIISELQTNRLIKALLSLCNGVVRFFDFNLQPCKIGVVLCNIIVH